jgi:peptide/nickel transport system permease protein
MNDRTSTAPAVSQVTTLRRLGRRLRKNRGAGAGLVCVTLIILMAVFAPVLTPHCYERQNLLNRLARPSAEHWMGTDELGRDIFTRVAYGARVSLLIGLSGSTGGLLVGVTLGLLCGFFGGSVDNLVSRFIDIMMAFPGVLLAILIVSVLGPGTVNLVIALTIWFTPIFTRISRGSVLMLREKEFIEAARSLGAPSLRIILRHLLLNSLSPIIVYFTLSVATSILVAAGLGFLGLGVQPPTPEWGAMVSTARGYLRDAPHLSIFPGTAIFITVLSINFIGDALRDALDPRLKAPS